MPGGKTSGLLEHSLCIQTHRLGANRSVDQFGNLLNDGFMTLAAALTQKRRVGRDAAQDAPPRGLPNFVDVRSIEKDSHHACFQTRIFGAQSRRRVEGARFLDAVAAASVPPSRQLQLTTCS